MARAGKLSPRKNDAKQSWYWKYFLPEACTPNNMVPKSICLLCAQPLTSDNSSLRKHLQSEQHNHLVPTLKNVAARGACCSPSASSSDTARLPASLDTTVPTSETRVKQSTLSFPKQLPVGANKLTIDKLVSFSRHLSALTFSVARVALSRCPPLCFDRRSPLSPLH